MVIYEDNHLLAVHKKPGELVQSDHTGDPTVLDKYKAYIKKKYSKAGAVFLHPTHRLDRPVSGCLLLARTSKALSRITTAFREGKVQKTYYAVCSERYDEIEGTLVHHILKDRDRNISKIVNAKQKRAKRAELQFQLMASVNSKYLYKINPVTGRSHQIRVQLSSIGCPIIGDVKYKGVPSAESRAIYLHCSSLTFDHPTKKEPLTISCLPDSEKIWDTFKPFII